MVVAMLNVKAPQIASASPGSLDKPDSPGGVAPAPLLPGEDRAEYAKLTSQFLATAKPTDFIEEILARDAIDLSWEIFRLRRLKAGQLRMACGLGVSIVADKLGYEPGPWRSTCDLSEQWMSGDPVTRNEFGKLLEKAGLSLEDVMGEVLSYKNKIDAFERVDHARVRSRLDADLLAAAQRRDRAGKALL
jgi:hypothetical protein